MIRVPVDELGAAIVAALGADYSGQNVHEHYFEITHELSGMVIGIFRVGYNERNTRLECRVKSPQGPTSNSMWLPSEPPSHITLAPTRPPKDLAREIVRRLVEVWLPLWPSIVAQQQKLIIEHDSAQTVIGEIAGMCEAGRVLDWSHREHAAWGSFERGESKIYVKAKVARHGEVDLNFTNLPTELAKKIIALIRDSDF